MSDPLLAPARPDGSLCPNRPRCPHPAFLHDVDEMDDPSPMCCVEGCACGKGKS